MRVLSIKSTGYIWYGLGITLIITTSIKQNIFGTILGIVFFVIGSILLGELK